MFRFRICMSIYCFFFLLGVGILQREGMQTNLKIQRRSPNGDAPSHSVLKCQGASILRDVQNANLSFWRFFPPCWFANNIFGGRTAVLG
jgi:hypothetical protein